MRRLSFWSLLILRARGSFSRLLQFRFLTTMMSMITHVEDDEKIEFLEFVDTSSPLDSLSGMTFLPNPLQEIVITSNFGMGFDPVKGHINNFRPMKRQSLLNYLPSTDDALVEQSQPFKRSHTEESKKLMQKRREKTMSRKRKFIAKRTDFDKGSRSKSETGYRGVRFSTNGCRFRSTVNVNKKPFNVGTFDTAKKAVEEYDQALIRITHGRVERSRLNFPSQWSEVYAEARRNHSKSCTEVDTDERPYKRQKLTHCSNIW